MIDKILKILPICSSYLLKGDKCVTENHHLLVKGRQSNEEYKVHTVEFLI
jgi:hypothetical protein